MGLTLTWLHGLAKVCGRCTCSVRVLCLASSVSLYVANTCCLLIPLPGSCDCQQLSQDGLDDVKWDLEVFADFCFQGTASGDIESTKMKASIHDVLAESPMSKADAEARQNMLEEEQKRDEEQERDAIALDEKKLDILRANAHGQALIDEAQQKAAEANAKAQDEYLAAEHEVLQKRKAGLARPN